MAGNLIDLRRRIKSVKDTQKITKAMKTVSAVKMRRSIMELNNTRPVMEKIQMVLKRVAPAVDASAHPLLEKREKGDILLVVLSADKGLCGAFNSHLIEAAEEHFEKLSEECRESGGSVQMVIAGNKAFKYFNNREYPIKKNYLSMMSRLKAHHAKELSQFLLDSYLSPGEDDQPIKKIEFINNKYISASRQEVTISQLFPIEQEWREEKGIGKNIEEEIEYIFEPSEDELFKYLLPRYVNSHVYQVLLQSSASEHSARMVAMELATQNASDMMKELTLTLNKLRQASITTELLEIITATEALTK